MTPNDIFSFITSPPDIFWLLLIKITFIAATIIMIAVIAAMISMNSWLKIRFVQDFFEFFSYRPLGIKKLAKQWAKISARLEKGIESEYKLAVIEVDSLFDDVLKRMGYAGESLGERLDKVAPAILPDIEKIREAHKVRNNIVHDPNYRLGFEDRKSVV